MSHRLMFLGEFHDIAGWIALTGFLMIIGGIVLWWPRTLLEAKRSLALNTRLKGMAFMLNLHKTAGLYGGVVLLVIAFFGMAMAFDGVKHGLYWVAGSEIPGAVHAAAAPPETQFLTLGRPVDQAGPLLTDPRDVTIRLPRKKGDAVQIIVVSASAPHPRARDDLLLDPVSGEVLRFVPYAQSSLGNKIYAWGVAIHLGQAGGWVGSLITFAGALTMPVLAYSGIASWLRRRRSRKALFSRAPSSPAASEAR